MDKLPDNGEDVPAPVNTEQDVAEDPHHPQYGSSMLLVFAMRMAAMFVLTTSNIGRSAGILPRWFTILGFVVAVGLLLTASLNSWLIVVFPGWILTFCVILLLRARHVSKGLVLPSLQAPGRKPSLLRQVSGS